MCLIFVAFVVAMYLEVLLISIVVLLAYLSLGTLSVSLSLHLFLICLSVCLPSPTQPLALPFLFHPLSQYVIVEKQNFRI